MHVAEARAFVEASSARWDLIQVALLDSFTAAAAGVQALSESPLYTVEALDAYVGHLAPGGMLAITRWLRVPPRDSLKLFATAVVALERAGVAAPERRLAAPTTRLKKPCFMGKYFVRLLTSSNVPLVAGIASVNVRHLLRRVMEETAHKLIGADYRPIRRRRSDDRGAFPHHGHHVDAPGLAGESRAQWRQPFQLQRFERFAIRDGSARFHTTNGWCM